MAIEQVLPGHKLHPGAPARGARHDSSERLSSQADGTGLSRGSRGGAVPPTDVIASVSKVSTDVEYLQRIEALARKVIDRSLDEGWLTLDPEDEVHQTPLQRAVNELARHLRHKHFEGDGCLDQD